GERAKHVAVVGRRVERERAVRPALGVAVTVLAESDTPEIEQRDRPLGLARERLVVHLGRRGVLTEPQQGHPVLVIHLGVPLVEDDGALQRFAHSEDRKSTRLNSSHVAISYAVFCLKKKKRNYASS